MSGLNMRQVVRIKLQLGRGIFKVLFRVLEAGNDFYLISLGLGTKVLSSFSYFVLLSSYFLALA